VGFRRSCDFFKEQAFEIEVLQGVSNMAESLLGDCGELRVCGD
jgi:hypothetical protein